MFRPYTYTVYVSQKCPYFMNAEVKAGRSIKKTHPTLCQCHVTLYLWCSDHVHMFICNHCFFFSLAYTLLFFHLCVLVCKWLFVTCDHNRCPCFIFADALWHRHLAVPICRLSLALSNRLPWQEQRGKERAKQMENKIKQGYHLCYLFYCFFTIAPIKMHPIWFVGVKIQC